MVLDEERSRFCEDLRSFTKSYGYGASDGKICNERSVEELEKLKKEEDLLLRGL